jgi:hypothetical protein
MDIFAMAYPIAKAAYDRPRTSEDLAKEYLDLCEKAALKQKSQVPPGFVLFTETERHHLDTRDFMNAGSGKDFMVSVARSVAKKIGAIASVFISEAWFAMANEKDREKIAKGEEFRPSKHENRVEVLMVIGEYKGMKPYLAASAFMRDTPGNVTGFRPLLLPGISGMETRFSHILDGTPAP